MRKLEATDLIRRGTTRGLEDYECKHCEAKFGVPSEVPHESRDAAAVEMHKDCPKVPQ